MRKTVIFTVVFVSMWAVLSYSTPGDTLWTRVYGDSLNEFIISAQQTSDGGYVASGYTYSYGSGMRDVYLVKVDSLGDTMWTRVYGGANEDGNFEIQQTSDGGYIIIGYTESFGAGSQDFYLIKTDANGDTLWTRTYGGSNYDQGGSVQQTSDGGYILTGLTKSYGAGNMDVWLIKTDANGDTIWTRTFGGIADDNGASVRQTSDGGYIIGGNTTSFGAGDIDVYVIKTDASGDTLWTRTYGGVDGDAAYYILNASDGGYVLAGDTDGFGAEVYDAYLLKIDSNGDSLWARTYGGSDWDVIYCIQETSDNGYLFSGFTYSFGAGEGDIYLIKTDINGGPMWTFIYGDTGDEGAYYAMETPDKNYFVAGGTSSYGAGGWDF